MTKFSFYRLQIVFIKVEPNFITGSCRFLFITLIRSNSIRMNLSDAEIIESVCERKFRQLTSLFPDEYKLESYVNAEKNA